MEPIESIPPLEVQTKQCKSCNSVLELSNFSKHPCTKDKLDNRCKTCMKEVRMKRKENEGKEYPVQPLDFENTDWQLGKHSGTILFREDTKSNSKRYEVRIVLGDGKFKSKSFALNNYESEEDAKRSAEKWRIQYSNENGLTKNMIRILDDSTIEVQLSKDKIMKTDIQFADICQKYCLCSSKSSRETAEHYAAITINNTLHSFHKHITGNAMTDHINRDPMDNRLCNLRETNHKLNNNNRNPMKRKSSDPDHILGIRYVAKDDSWQARIKQNGKEYTKSFSVKKFGEEVAKQLAITTRQALNTQFHCTNG